LNSKNNSALIIFLRAPILGQVKTRLAASLGDKAALNIYRKLVEITLAEAHSSHFTTYLYFYPEIDPSLIYSGFIAKEQYGDDLGEKMKHAFTETMKRHDRAVIIGTDCPYINIDLIHRAFASLRQSDVVIGPASDGGYYLLGLRKIIPELFENIPWSTENVLTETVKRLEKFKLSLTTLETLDDIDYEEDWNRYLDSLG
jgi:rSAM/selenodomain-associated transferase 1